MSSRMKMVFAALLVCVIGAGALAHARSDDTAEPKQPSPEKSSVAQQRFEKIKAMAGRWTMRGENGELGTEPTHTYRVTAGGSAVLETIFPGKPMEMITLYHMDGKNLVLTHYCVLGNQPHMVAKADGDASEIEFVCRSCTKDPGANISGGAHHMHHATFEFISTTNVRTVWSAIENAKPTHRVESDMVRMED